MWTSARNCADDTRCRINTRFIQRVRCLYINNENKRALLSFTSAFLYLGASEKSRTKRHRLSSPVLEGTESSGHVTEATRALWYSSKLPQFLRCTLRRAGRRGKRRKPRKPSVEGELSFLGLAVASFRSLRPVVRDVYRPANVYRTYTVVPAGRFRRCYFSHGPREKVWSFRPAK